MTVESQRRLPTGTSLLNFATRLSLIRTDARRVQPDMAENKIWPNSTCQQNIRVALNKSSDDKCRHNLDTIQYIKLFLMG